MFNPTWGNWCSNLTIFWQSYGLVQPPTRKHHGVFFDLFFLGRMELLLAPFNIKSWYPPSRNFRRQPEMSGLFQGFLKKMLASRCWGVTCGMDQDDVVFLLTSYTHPLKTQLLGGDLSKKKWGEVELMNFLFTKISNDPCVLSKDVITIPPQTKLIDLIASCFKNKIWNGWQGKDFFSGRGILHRSLT